MELGETYRWFLRCGLRAMSVDTRRREGFDFLSPFRFLSSCYEAVFDAFLGAFLLFLGLIRGWLLSLGGDASFWLLALFVLGMSAFNRDFARVGIAPVYITEVILALLLVMVTPRLLVGDTLWLPRQPAARRIIVILALYVIYGLLRLSPSILFGGGDLLETLRNFALFYYGIFGLIGWWILQGPLGKKRSDTLLWGIVVVSTLTNTYFACSFILTAGVVDDPYVKVISGQAALFSLFSALILFAVLLHGAFQVKDNPVFFGAAIGALLLHITLIFFSGHRSGLLALAAAMGVVWLSGKRRLRLNFRWVAVALLFAVLILSWGAVDAYFKLISQKYETFFQLSDEPNAAWRFVMWIRLLTLWSSSPIFGVGFSYDFATQEPWGVMTEERIDPHNSYVAILARTGIVGLGLVLYVLWSVGRLLIRLKRGMRQNSDLFLADSLLGCLTAVAVYASMNVILETPYHGIFFWLLMGMAGTLAEYESKRNHRLVPPISALSVAR